jgi:8-oxo-dGTP pyrophosphatase MutT (NUDIX family)
VSLDGKPHRINLSAQKYRGDRKKSEPHSVALSLLLELFPGLPVFQEITIPGGMYLDIFLPTVPLIVEVHGEQHYTFTPFFHKSKANFLLAKKRDRDKLEWARLNEIPMAVLPHNERDTWKSLILEALQD